MRSDTPGRVRVSMPVYSPSRDDLGGVFKPAAAAAHGPGRGLIHRPAAAEPPRNPLRGRTFASTAFTPEDPLFRCVLRASSSHPRAEARRAKRCISAFFGHFCALVAFIDAWARHLLCVSAAGIWTTRWEPKQSAPREVLATSTERIRSNALILSLLALVALAPVTLWAQTRDGATPAEEEVCDALSDATPGLYGLCVAYCEAQDCDSVDLAISGQCRAPNQRLLDHYEKKRQSEDPPMPCLTPAPDPCPCFSREDLSTVQVNTCFTINFRDESVLVITDDDDINGAIVEVGPDGWGLCGVFHGDGGTLEISPEEVTACELVIRSRADELGLECRETFPL